MPTSPRDLRGGNGGMICTDQPLWPRTFRADVGIRPYAGERFYHATWPGLCFKVSPPHLPISGRHPLQAGEGGGWILRHQNPRTGPAGSGKNPLRLVSCHLQVQIPVLPGGILPGNVRSRGVFAYIGPINGTEKSPLLLGEGGPGRARDGCGGDP